MSLLQCHDLSFSHGSAPLFEAISFAVEPSERIGLVGGNGSGKSTLLGLLAGALAPDAGKISVRRGLSIQRVPQFLPGEIAGHTVFEAVSSNAKHPDRTHVIERVLGSAGFAPRDFERPVRELSGGWINRLLVARALAGEPELLLLDEPTNHMDLRSLLFFERLLTREVRCAFVLVSHDRTLLDACTTRTLFLRDRRLYPEGGAYSIAKERLLERDAAAMVARRAEEREIERLRVSQKRLALWGKTFDSDKLSARAKSMEKRIEKLEEAKTFVSQGPKRPIALDTQEARAALALRCERAVVERPGGGGALFSITGLYIKKGDRVAVLGKNGAGKSVFLRCLIEAQRALRAGEAGASPFVWNPQFELGYYDQLLSGIDTTASAAKILRDEANLTDLEITRTLIRAGFPLADHRKPAGEMSGGERARLRFVLLKLARPSLLILDEPTNHLDIEGCEDLEAEILDSGATMLVVSHDRRFVANVATRYVLIDKGELREIADPAIYYAMEAGGDGGFDSEEGEGRPQELERSAVRNARASASASVAATASASVAVAATASVAAAASASAPAPAPASASAPAPASASAPAPAPASVPAPASAPASASVDEGVTAEEILAQILRLEDKLRADRRQKPERQNRTRQRQWEEEITALYALLERMG